MKKNFKKGSAGFTLIELLVVIAIIGILASVVLASLNSARNKGADAAIKASLTNARAQAELFYDAGTTYAGVCAAGSSTNGIQAMVTGAAQKLASAQTVGATSQAYVNTATTWPTVGAAVCHDSAAGWAAIVQLKSPATGAGYGWCVDNSGTAKEANTLTASSVTCGS